MIGAPFVGPRPNKTKTIAPRDSRFCGVGEIITKLGRRGRSRPTWRGSRSYLKLLARIAHVIADFCVTLARGPCDYAMQNVYIAIGSESQQLPTTRRR
jgi:hypothetical protein